MGFEKLFEPIEIGTMKIENRFVVPAMDSGTTTAEHTFSKQSIEYFAAKAKGGFGLIIPEYMAVTQEGIGNPKEVGIWDDRFIPNLKELTDRIHVYSGKVAAQLHHSGLMCKQKDTGVQPAGPSAMAANNNLELVREYDNQEVYELIEAYSDAAVRAQKAGFDAVEVHAAHGYLVAQFLSKATNKRVDEFGGSFENRFRFAGQIIKQIKEKCGSAYPVIFRISAEEFLDGGNSIEECVIYSTMAEDVGADAIHVSTGTGMGGNIVTPLYFDPGFNVKNAEEVKKAVKIPVISVGRINDPYLANQIVSSNQADMVSLGRQSIADPEFPNKVKEGRISEIFVCTGCMQRCYYSPGCDEDDKGISCLINPLSGKEYLWEIKETEKPKKITIIGAGPGGLEAAWILAKRNHDVTVYEKQSTPGGMYKLAAVPPKKQDLAKTIHTYTVLCEKYGAKLVYNTEVTEEMLLKMNSDVIIVATGSQPLLPPIKGLDPVNCSKANEILSGKKLIANKKVLVIGGGLVGCEVGELLNFYKNDVSIVEMAPTFAKDATTRVRIVLIDRLKKDGTQLYANTKVTEILDNGIIGEVDGKRIELEGYDEVVIALGSINYNPFENIEKDGTTIYTIGDALKARDAKYSIYEAAKLSLSL